MYCNNLFPVAKEPTLLCEHGSTLIDFLITNIFSWVFVDSKTLSPSSTCDHTTNYARINIAIKNNNCDKMSACIKQFFISNNSHMRVIPLFI